MAQQVVLIHGGEVFDTYEEYLDFLRSYEVSLEKPPRWRDVIAKRLGKNFEVIAPQMPNKYNAKYEEWKIWFEHFVPFIQDDVILVGGSLGGLFLAKYLSENTFSRTILATMLLAAPHDGELNESIGDFALPESIAMFGKQAGKLFLFHSEDDPVVPFNHVEKYALDLPDATKMLFTDKGHFIDDEFPELVKLIKKVVKK